MVARRVPSVRSFDLCGHGNLHPPWRTLRRSGLEAQRLSNGDHAIRLDLAWTEHGPRSTWAYRLEWLRHAEVGFWDRAEARGLSRASDEAAGAKARILDALASYLTSDHPNPPSDRERQVGELVVLEGCTHAYAADLLGIDVRTVDNYMARLRVRARIR
jgi:hypothetical protein